MSVTPSPPSAEPSPSDRYFPPALLTMADFYGTLAAARCLGRAGIPITMAESRLLAPARWSRYVARRVNCPDVGDSERFMAWLLEFGAREPGHVLYPTCDDLAWLYSVHREELGRHFRLFQPSPEAIFTLLNKKSLHLAAKEVGIDVPRCWYPEDGPLERVIAEATFPVLIKPRTQILFRSRVKGKRVDRPEDLAGFYREFTQRNPYQRYILEREPSVAQPIIQEYHREAAENIYNLSGFVDQTGELSGMRASVKVLQRPRQLGIGLCFEDAEVKTDLAAKLSALCRKVGYHGVFEVEFIQTAGHLMLIDFNPRFYNQMAFDIARSLPLPLLVYEAALGNADGVRAALVPSNGNRPAGKQIFCHRLLLEILLRAQSLSGRLSPEELRTWKDWYESNRPRATDAVADDSDPLPGVVDLAQHLLAYMRHPRAFLRSVVLDRPGA